MASPTEVDLLGTAIEKLLLSKEESAGGAQGKHAATISNTDKRPRPITDTTGDGQTGSKDSR